jgi:hypothetical protein
VKHSRLWCRCITLNSSVELSPVLTLAHFRAQLEDLRGHIAHGRAQHEHLRDTSTVSCGIHGGQSKLKLSLKGQSKLKLSGNGNECTPLVVPQLDTSEVLD